MNLGGAIHLNKRGFILLIAVTLILFIYMISNSSTSDKVPSTVKINLKNLLKVAIKAAENGGNEVVENKNNLDIKSKGLTKEGLPETVTTADLLSHCAMIKTLKQVYPLLNVISEEKKIKCKEDKKVDYSEIDVPSSLKNHWENVKDITVWIDPLDATLEYTGKLYDYVTTMVCVAVKGKPIIGVIHKPFNSDSKTFWSWVNNAHSDNLKYKNQEDEKLKIIISMSHNGQIQEVLKKSMKNFKTISAAGAGYKSLEVAIGNVDAYVHITAIKKWDICAGNAIINALGGKMTTNFNDVIDYTDQTNVVNEKGLIATMKNHDMFIGKLNVSAIQ